MTDPQPPAPADADDIKRRPRPRCAAEPGSPCRSRGGAVASSYHTGRFTKAPRFAKLLRVPTPADRRPGQPWRPGTPPPAPVDPDTPGADIRIGYARCSALGQELDSQLDALTRHGIPREKIFSEKISRTKARLTGFLGPDWSILRDEPAAEAAHYPQVIELTRLLPSPYWRALILDDHLPASTPRSPGEMLGVPARFCWLMESTPGIERFVQEVRRTVHPWFRWNPSSSYRSYEPFTRWVLDELEDRFSPSLYGSWRHQPEIFEREPTVARSS